MTHTHRVSALYGNLGKAYRALSELHKRDIPSQDVALLSHATNYDLSRYFDADGRYVAEDPSEAKPATEEGLEIGAVLGGIGGFLAGLTTVVIPGVGPLLAAGGVLAGVITGASLGGLAGGLVGVLIDLGIPDDTAKFFADEIAEGGALVTVLARDEATAHEVAQALRVPEPLQVDERVRAIR